MALLFIGLIGATSVLASEEVRLKQAQFTPYYENGFDHAELEGTVEVKNIGAKKQVWLHYQSADGVWLDHPAFYVAPTADGYEAFTFRLPLVGAVAAVKFAIKYQVNGQTYWDSNDTQNYHFDGHGQTAFLHQAVAVDDASRRYSDISIRARSRFSDAQDRVTVVYSLDKWQHQSRREMNLSHTVGDVQGASGLWDVSLYAEYYRTFDYYLEYESDGQIHIDNYYGKGYHLMPFRDSYGYGSSLQQYPQFYFRGEPTGWNSLPMMLVDDYTWSILVYFDGTTDFKFDAYGDWSRNFGDSNQDGIIDPKGANLKVNSVGSIQITVNTQTGVYLIEAL
jgi:hypothetical protein